jgi:hypothetical protein
MSTEGHGEDKKGASREAPIFVLDGRLRNPGVFCVYACILAAPSKPLRLTRQLIAQHPPWHLVHRAARQRAKLERPIRDPYQPGHGEP